MQLGMVGLGRMGANIVRRLMRDGHECVVYDVNPDSIKELEGEGAIGGSTLEEFVGKLQKPRVAWVMIPAGITGKTVDQLAGLMEEGDIIIDGGNSNYRDDVRRAAKLKEQGIHYVDIGTSGGVFGLERGYCLMVGGPDEAVTIIDPILKTIAPGVGDIERTPGRSGELAPEEQGYLHCGSSGAGHFVKMVHNGIEYGIMAAFAEGLNILDNADVGHRGGGALRRDRPDGGAGVLPVPDQHRQGRRTLAPGIGDLLMAAGSDGGRAASQPDSRRPGGPGIRLG